MAFRSISGVQGVSATATITVTNYLNLVTKTVTVGSTVLTEGAAADFLAAISNDATATSLAAAIDGLTGISASANAAVVTITIDATGTAGNLTALSTNSTSAVTLAAFSGGVDQVLASGAIGRSGSAIRLYNINCKSFSSGTKTTQILNGTDSSGTEYDLLTGIASQSILHDYKVGMVLPSGCYIVSGDGVSFVTAEFETIG